MDRIIENSWIVCIGTLLDSTRMQVRAAITAVRSSDPKGQNLEDLKVLEKKLKAAAFEFEAARQRAMRALDGSTDD